MEKPIATDRDALREVLRQGAWRMLAQIVAVEAFVAAHEHIRDAQGRRLVIRNGYLPERTIQTGIGDIAVRVPRARDRSGSDIRFRFAILPPYLRRTISIEELIPWLYLQGISTGDFSEALAALLGPDTSGLSPATVSRSKEVRRDELDEVQRALGDESAGARALDDLLSLMGRVGFGDTLVFDITVVRGLSYYTGTVFELRDRSANLRAICGGGRYESLLSTYGGPEIPAIGFGFGDVVILELLGDLGLLPDLRSEIDYVVFPFSDEQVPAALEISQQLRRKGYRADADFGSRKLKRALQRAGDMGARHAILLMPDEMARGEIVVRDLERREEQRVGLDAFLEGLG